MTLPIDQAWMSLNHKIYEINNGKNHKVQSPGGLYPIYAEALRLTKEVSALDFPEWINQMQRYNGLCVECVAQKDFFLNFSSLKLLQPYKRHFETILTKADLSSGSKILQLAAEISELSLRALGFELGKRVYRNLLEMKNTRCFVMRNQNQETIGFALGMILTIQNDQNQGVRVLKWLSIARKVDYPGVNFLKEVSVIEKELIVKDQLDLIVSSVVLTNLKVRALFEQAGFNVQEEFLDPLTREKSSFMVKKAVYWISFIPHQQEVQQAMLSCCKEKMGWVAYVHWAAFQGFSAFRRYWFP